MIVSKRGTTNIIATMLIFSIMITSMGVLYSQISPTLLSFESRTNSANQEFIMQNIASEVQELISSAEGNQRRVKIVSDQTSYDMSTGTSLNITIKNGNTAISSETVNIGQFGSTVNGSFLSSPNPSYLNRVFNEDSFVNNDSQETSVNYVSKGDFSTNTGEFTLYFRSRVSVDKINGQDHLMTIVMVQITFLEASDGSPLDFPIQRQQWTLRLRRQPSEILSEQTISNPTNTISLTQQIDGEAGTSFQYPAIDDGTGDLTIRFLRVPILFAI